MDDHHNTPRQQQQQPQPQQRLARTTTATLTTTTTTIATTTAEELHNRPISISEDVNLHQPLLNGSVVSTTTTTNTTSAHATVLAASPRWLNGTRGTPAIARIGTAVSQSPAGEAAILAQDATPQTRGDIVVDGEELAAGGMRRDQYAVPEVEHQRAAGVDAGFGPIGKGASGGGESEGERGVGVLGSLTRAGALAGGNSVQLKRKHSRGRRHGGSVDWSWSSDFGLRWVFATVQQWVLWYSGANASIFLHYRSGR